MESKEIEEGDIWGVGGGGAYRHQGPPSNEVVVPPFVWES